ncbi:alpha/beta hydrolase family protein [Arenimonas terrae]|jgi:pimeloyl-ACP methyl ester carboxylesterase|uniref:Alpha/beta hydrolase n=1 Tax=Arenimonas terrae TaxID=2546226 RepID=A0A5C4RP66_9GAMM|nr:alpha/beta hydrolase [Arenimonas terrae]TNJ32930.1 alpha/beta hydrolase [Arenimonas terrae]
MKWFAVLLLAWSLGADARAETCPAGAFRNQGNAPDLLVLAPVESIPAPGLRWLFLDGRRGSTLDADSMVRCRSGAVEVRTHDGSWRRWSPIELARTDVEFTSAATPLAGRLIEPAATAEPLPLVVMVHGSERTPALDSPYAYLLAAQRIRVFVYDKRGTGRSAGQYTQNFELLAEDAANALAQARVLAAGRYDRAGYFGGSQGGWVAPLAATRAPADFVAVGFGLVVSPIDEDREQMIAEAHALGLGPEALQGIERLSKATAELLTSHFESGYEALAAVREDPSTAAWAGQVKGEHSGAMLLTPEAELRRIGRARFDNLELIWDYDAVAALRKLEAPLLWVLAEKDREAPIERTRDLLLSLASAGQPIDIHLFPDTDHGMVEFTEAPDGSRQVTRITDGYLRLLGDWIRGVSAEPYGRGVRLQEPKTRLPD